MAKVASQEPIGIRWKLWIPLIIAVVGSVTAIVLKFVEFGAKPTPTQEPHSEVKVQDSFNDNSSLAIKDSFNKKSTYNSKVDQNTQVQQQQLSSDTVINNSRRGGDSINPTLIKPTRSTIQQIESVTTNSYVEPINVEPSSPPPDQTRRLRVQEMIALLTEAGYIVRSRPASPQLIAENQGVDPGEALLLDTLAMLLDKVNRHEQEIRRLQAELGYQRVAPAF
jgi:hypothetical protein